MKTDLLEEIEGIRTSLEGLTVPKSPQFRSLGKDILEDSESKEAELLDGVSDDFDLRQRKFFLNFKKTYFIEKIIVTFEDGFSFKKVEINCVGGGKDTSFTLGKSFFKPVEGGEELSINSYMVGVSFSSSGRFGGKVRKVEIIGCEAHEMKSYIDGLSEANESMVSVSGLFKGALESASNVVTEINAEIKGIDELEADVLEKEKLKAELTSTIEKLESKVTTTKDHLEELRTKLSSESDIVENLKIEKSDLKNSISDLKKEEKGAQENLNKKLEESSFFSENIADHKKEIDNKIASKNKLLYLFSALITGVLLIAVLSFESAITAILEAGKGNTHFIAAATLKTAIGSFCLYAIKRLSLIVMQLLRIIGGLESDKIESERLLFLSREVANTSCEGLDFTSTEKRNYKTYLKLLNLKNHISSINPKALSEELGIEEEKLSLAKTGKFAREFIDAFKGEKKALDVPKTKLVSKPPEISQ